MGFALCFYLFTFPGGVFMSPSASRFEVAVNGFCSLFLSVYIS